jgi:hypothetical protein
LIQIYQPYHESDPDREVEGPVEVDGCDEGPEEGAVLKLGMLEGDEAGKRRKYSPSKRSVISVKANGSFT